MTIDEAIAKEKELAEKDYLQGMLCHANPNDEKLDGYIESGKYHEQLAEWLEELKELRELKASHLYAVAFNRGYTKAENDYHAQSEKDRQSSYDCGYELGYSKAIDDFAVTFKSKTSMENMLVDEIAEQLKAGGENV